MKQSHMRVLWLWLAASVVAAAILLATLILVGTKAIDRHWLLVSAELCLAQNRDKYLIHTSLHRPLFRYNYAVKSFFVIFLSTMFSGVSVAQVSEREVHDWILQRLAGKAHEEIGTNVHLLWTADLECTANAEQIEALRKQANASKGHPGRTKSNLKLGMVEHPIQRVQHLWFADSQLWRLSSDQQGGNAPLTIIDTAYNRSEKWSSGADGVNIMNAGTTAPTNWDPQGGLDAILTLEVAYFFGGFDALRKANAKLDSLTTTEPHRVWRAKLSNGDFTWIATLKFDEGVKTIVVTHLSLTSNKPDAPKTDWSFSDFDKAPVSDQYFSRSFVYSDPAHMNKATYRLDSFESVEPAQIEQLARTPHTGDLDPLRGTRHFKSQFDMRDGQRKYTVSINGQTKSIDLTSKPFGLSSHQRMIAGGLAIVGAGIVAYKATKRDTGR